MKTIWLKISHFHYGSTLLHINLISLQVTIEEDSLLSHPTRDRAKIPLGRRLPTRGHLMAVVGGFSFQVRRIERAVLIPLLKTFCYEFEEMYMEKN